MSKIIEHEMRFKVVMMTPTWAQELLDKNHPRNRRQKEKRITEYARDMQQGYWHLTPEPVCVDLDGWLTNGQNRLSAVVRAGVEVPMSIVTGCPRDAIIGQDMGARRTVADMASISGDPLPHGASTFPGIVRVMYAGLTPLMMTNSEVIAFGKEHGKAIDFAFECLPKNTKALTQSAVRAVIARAYYRRNLRWRTRLFCEYLMSGLPENPKPDSGAIRLRNWLVETFLGGRGAGPRRASPRIVYAKTERALKAFHDQEYVQSLIEMKRELFPLPGESAYVEEPDPVERNGVFTESRAS